MTDREKSKTQSAAEQHDADELSDDALDAVAGGLPNLVERNDLSVALKPTDTGLDAGISIA